jgi:hypothetical protein
MMILFLNLKAMEEASCSGIIQLFASEVEAAGLLLTFPPCQA